jgi:4-amino-4-deoxy-L-arabinose transferase-like glycosyltransferase
VLLWGGWLLVNGLVFSYMQGLAHSYYAVAIAPPIAALIGVAGREAWRRRGSWFARVVLAAMVAAGGAWSYVLLNRVPTWYPEVRYTLVGLCALAVIGLLAGGLALKRVAVAGLAAAVLAGVAGSAAYAVDTVAIPRTGPDPSSGPAQTTSMSSGSMSSGSMPSGGTGGTGSQGGAAANAELTSLLAATNTTWAAATVGVSSGASLELSSGRNIMAVGGFTGTDASPTLAQFKKYVAQGKVRYFISSGRGGIGGSRANTVADAISSWVSAHYAPTTVGGQTVYDLSNPTSS